MINVSAALLAIGALFQVFDSAQATTMGALRGYKATVTPMWIAVVAYWLVGLPFGAALCFGVGSIPTLHGLLSSAFGAPIGVYGLWWGLVVGLAVAAVALLGWLVRVSQSRSTPFVRRIP